ncbi:glycoside hydrolase family 28 protein [Opitutales bacterium ASA1]|uniref:rhamnogalacturonidase n=1 Tax=Congregicoccus parvus TaxID=3081749 RepID=UPI002B3167D5|nr:glycoside hydrolase family 28 protein [Opitutales bacterium ASA1]
MNLPFQNVRDHGALGDGTTLDTEAINAAVSAASAAGGGTVFFPAGTYLSFSIRLRSHVALHLDQGAVLLAADPRFDAGGFDAAEPNEWGDVHRYQDFGHSHWHNSLIHGEHLENVSITGPGLIHGAGLTRTSQSRPGIGNKAIALKLCRNVVLRDFSMLQCGHFALLATGVDNLTIDNLKVDTNRDALDIDCCRHVRISNCTVNTMNDDGIVLKSSYALGFLRATENVTITNCEVSGFDPGSVLDGTYRRNQRLAPDRDGPTGRIKLGTESNGGFRNIVVSNCVFDRCRGLALETVDGGVIEDVVVSNITMRDLDNSPLFVRIGNRARGPAGTPVGAIRRVKISHVVAYGADARYSSIIGGLRDHPIEDLEVSDVRFVYTGGITMEQVATQPAEMTNPFFMCGQKGAGGPRDPYAVPELEKGYPEPSAFGIMPSYGLYLRHARRVTLRNVSLSYLEHDERVPIVLDQVEDVCLERVDARRAEGVPVVVLRDVRDVEFVRCRGIADTRIESAARATL